MPIYYEVCKRFRNFVAIKSVIAMQTRDAEEPQASNAQLYKNIIVIVPGATLASGISTPFWERFSFLLPIF